MYFLLIIATYTRTHPLTDACAHGHTLAHRHMHTCVHTHMHTHTFMHTCTYTPPRERIKKAEIKSWSW